MMKKICCTAAMVLFFLASGAQKKGGHPSPKTPVLTKEERERRIEEPYSLPKVNGSAPPDTQIVNRIRKFNAERYCSDCETLVLEPGKPHIVLYAIKQMSDRQMMTYLQQPSDYELSLDYPTLDNALFKREREELLRHFPEEDFQYHYIRRNTFIEIENVENLNLLDRWMPQEGVLYWSGKADASPVQQLQLPLATEMISDERGEHQSSSYELEFQKDKTYLATLAQTVQPDPALSDNMNSFLLSQLMDENVLMLQLFKLDHICKMTLVPEIEREKTWSLYFNREGQLTELEHSGRRDCNIIYKDGLPAAVTTPQNKVTLYYQGNIVIMQDSLSTHTFEMKDKMFFNKERFFTDEENYRNRTFHKMKDEIGIEKEATCNREYFPEEQATRTICYSNTFWELPLTITTRFKRVEEKKLIYRADEQTILVIEEQNRPAWEYKMTEGRLTKITFFKDGIQPLVVNVYCEYYK